MPSEYRFNKGISHAGWGTGSYKNKNKKCNSKIQDWCLQEVYQEEIGLKDRSPLFGDEKNFLPIKNLGGQWNIH